MQTNSPHNFLFHSFVIFHWTFSISFSLCFFTGYSNSGCWFSWLDVSYSDIRQFLTLVNSSQFKNRFYSCCVSFFHTGYSKQRMLIFIIFISSYRDWDTSHLFLMLKVCITYFISKLKMFILSKQISKQISSLKMFLNECSQRLFFNACSQRLFLKTRWFGPTSMQYL